MPERILITGATGCIGRTCLSWLRAAGFADLVSLTRLKSDPQDPGIDHIGCDIADQAVVGAAINKVQPSRIVHLAGLQTPDCQAHPFQGMAVNVEGTHHLWRAAARLGSRLKRVVFASSAAVYGPRSMYPGPTVGEDAGLQPPNLYGHWKVAGEGATQALHLESGVPAVALRLATTYGPGRDRGLTSAPTSAMKALVAGERFEMTYQGREHYHYVNDVGAAFAICTMEDFSGYGVFNVRGQTLATRDFVQLIRETAEQLGMEGGEIVMPEDLPPMPFVCDLDASAICARFSEMPLTEVKEGVRKSLERFRAA